MSTQMIPIACLVIQEVMLESFAFSMYHAVADVAQDRLATGVPRYRGRGGGSRRSRGRRTKSGDSLPIDRGLRINWKRCTTKS